MSDGYEGPVLVTAHLSSPLAGDAPQLDALLEWANSAFYQPSRPSRESHYKITRAGPAPPQGAIGIPLVRCTVAHWRIALSSSPIFAPERETVNYVNKRLATEAADLLAPEERKIVATTNTWTKSYRLPLRIRLTDRVCWFAVGGKKEIRKCLREIHAIGKKTADGYGRVKEWSVAKIDLDHSWFSPHDTGTVIMRPLPLHADGREWLPQDLLGAKPDFGACVAPYWHPERQTEIMVPV